MATGNRVRLTLDLTDALNKRLEQIADDLGTTKSDVIKRSLALMDVVNQAQKEGSRLAISEDGASVKKEILVM